MQGLEWAVLALVVGFAAGAGVGILIFHMGMPAVGDVVIRSASFVSPSNAGLCAGRGDVVVQRSASAPVFGVCTAGWAWATWVATLTKSFQPLRAVLVNTGLVYRF